MKKSKAWWCKPVIPVIMGSAKQKDCGLGQPRQKERPYLQNNQNKQGQEAWLKQQSLALCSNPNTIKINQPINQRW
jgi:hypothetical protein